MVKANYTPLKDINDRDKSIKVKAKVISKGEPKQTPPKRRYQKVLLQDDEGTTIDGTIFGEDIEMFEQAIVKNGEYEFSNMVIKPVPESFRSRASSNFQINFNSNVRITPLDLSGCSDEPQYRKLDKIPRSHSAEDELIDTIGVVLFVADVRSVSHDGVENKVRDIIIADQSCDIRPVRLSAWNEKAEEKVVFYDSWAEGFHVIGFRNVLPVTYRGIALKTGQSTSFVENLNSEIVDSLRSWVEEKKQLLEDWRGKAMEVYSSTINKTPKPLIDMEKKKANTIWTDEKFWIQVSMPGLEARDIHCYVGCTKCGKTCSENVGTKFVCGSCHAKDGVAAMRVLMNVAVSDKTGSLKVTAFASEAELIIGLKANEVADLKRNDNPGALEKRIVDLRKKEMLLQIAPSNTLFVNSVLKWVVRSVEVPLEEV